MQTLVAEIRVRVAFEHMLVAALLTAGASAAAALIANIVVQSLASAWSVEAAVRIVVGAATFGFVVFLIGFFAAVVVGAPLFAALEKAKIRTAHPWFVAAIAVEVAALWLIYGRFPLGPPTPPSAYLLFLPGLLFAFLFVRAMRPLWRQAERADSTAPGAPRLH